MPRISYNDPTGVHREVTLGPCTRLGRHPTQDVQILDRVVSKAHAVIEAEGDGYVVYDAGSRNGTMLNGTKVEGRARLTDGDEIHVGSVAVRFHDKAPEPKVAPVQILEEGYESAIRSRLRDTGPTSFLPVEQVDDVTQLKADYEKLRIANDLNQAVAAEFDIDKLLNAILEKAIEMFGADRGVIMLRDIETGELETSAMKVRYEEIAGGKAVRISKTILREVMEEKAAVLSSDAQMDSRFGGAQSIVLSGIKATMSVPLLYRDELLGIIHLDSQLTSGVFTDKDLHLLTGFAQQAANAIEHARVVQKLREEAVVREKLGRLLSPEVVEQVISSGEDIQPGGAQRPVSVLFADIRGFTSMSERYPAAEIVEILNEYFEIMVDIIFRHNGTLDKFVGDEIMAVWGAPFGVDDHCFKAISAGVEMQRAVTEFNETRAQEGLTPIHIGIGVNTGDVVAGYMGSSKAMDYTVIGDVVNVGARLCSAAAPGEVIVAQPALDACGERLECEAMPARSLKGKAEPVPLFKVLDTK